MNERSTSVLQITESVILDRLIEAQVVLRFLSMRGVRPAQAKTFWPDMTDEDRRSCVDALVRAKCQLDKLDREVIKQRTTLHPADVSRMEEAMLWPMLISRESFRKAVVVQSFCYSRKLGQRIGASMFGSSQPKLRSHFNNGISDLMIELCNRNQYLAEAREDLIFHLRPKSAIYSDKMRSIAA